MTPGNAFVEMLVQAVEAKGLVVMELETRHRPVRLELELEGRTDVRILISSYTPLETIEALPSFR